MAKTRMTVDRARDIALHAFIDSINVRKANIIKEYMELQNALYDEYFPVQYRKSVLNLPFQLRPNMVGTLRIKLSNNSDVPFNMYIEGIHRVSSSVYSERLSIALHDLKKVNNPYIKSLVPDNRGRAYEPSPDLKERFVKFYEKNKDILVYGQDIEIINKTIKALRRFKYVEDLETGWSEIWPHAQKIMIYQHAPSAAMTLPVVSIQEINALLKLPT